jgi:endonuclease YncB( thermonuclease family)
MSTPENPTPTAPNPWHYPATLLKVTDGDTAVFRLTRTVEIDFGFRFKTTMTVSFEAAFRMCKINAPEIHSQTPREKAAALVAKAKLEELLALGPLTIESQKPMGPLASDLYGRWLCLVKIAAPDREIDAAMELISLGLVVPYDGKQARLPWVDPHADTPHNTPAAKVK